MMIKYYFAYGSNMNAARVAERGLRVSTIEAGILDTYHLVFDKIALNHVGEGHANIVHRSDSRVEGVIYGLQHSDEILKMDPYEKAPINYGRDAVEILCSDGPKWAWTYFANDGVRKHGCLPSRKYLDHLLAGREYLSDEYFTALESQPVIG
jgi:gamma-glutamylcyclotransferase (GGCT)/AIG2-like uncharacterized protein YtfP